MVSLPGGRYRNKNELFLSALNNCAMEQLVKVPTRVVSNVSNVLDLLITNVPQLIHCVTTCTGISDHLAVIVQLENLCRRRKVKRPLQLYNRANFQEINNLLFEYYLEFSETAAERTVNENWSQFKEYLKSVQNLIPSRMISANLDPPWYSLKLKRLDQKQRKLHQKAKRYQSDILLQKYKDTRALVKSAYKEAERNYKNRLGSALKDNSKHFWKYVKAKRGKRIGISSIISESGDVVHDAKSIADVLNNQYKSVFCTDNAIDSSPIRHRTSETMQPVEINYHGIVGLLEKIQVSKSCGLDGVSGALLKNCAKVLRSSLRLFSNNPSRQEIYRRTGEKP